MKIMALCWPLKTSLSCKAVLMSLADNANDEGHCWPSIPTIAMRTCMTERSVTRAIAQLETEGLLSVDRSNGRHSKYQLRTEPLTESHGLVVASHDHRQPVTPDTLSPTPDTVSALPRQSVSAPPTQCPPNPKEPSRNPKGTVNKRATRIPDGWTPSADDVRFANERGVPVALEAEKFRNHWTGSSSKSATSPDWAAKWRTWVLNAVTFAQSRPGVRLGKQAALEENNRRAVDDFLRMGEPHAV